MGQSIGTYASVGISASLSANKISSEAKNTAYEDKNKPTKCTN